MAGVPGAARRRGDEPGRRAAHVHGDGADRPVSRTRPRPTGRPGAGRHDLDRARPRAGHARSGVDVRHRRHQPWQVHLHRRPTPGGHANLTVTAIAGTSVDGDRVFATSRSIAPATTAKTWVSAAVSVTPPTATNLVGEPHTFTVMWTCWARTARRTRSRPRVRRSLGASTGPGVLDAGATTCDDVGTTAAGTCDIVFTNTAAGAGTLTIESVTFTANGESFTVGLTEEEPGQATAPPVTASKTWVGYLVTVSPSATNPVDSEHVFTITATLSDGTPVEGATITYTLGGAGAATPPSSCTTDADGECTVSVTSAASGAGTLTVTSLTDGDFDVDLTTAGAPGQAPGQECRWRRPRRGWRTGCCSRRRRPTSRACHTRSRRRCNRPGWRTRSRADWAPVPDGTTLTATTEGEGTIDPDSTCLTPGTAAGTCTFVVEDAGPGTLDADRDRGRRHHRRRHELLGYRSR